jgi:uncharacterized protein (TIGR03435 family)
MLRSVVIVGIVWGGVFAAGQSTAGPQTGAAPRPKFDTFEVASIKRVDVDAKAGRYIAMQGTDRFVAKNYSLKLLIAAAYSLNPRTISGGPVWGGSDCFDIAGVTSGGVRPTHDEQMRMLQALLADRFKLVFHREPKELSIYALEVAKSGPKLNLSMAGKDSPPVVGPGVLYEGTRRVVLPGRNATMSDLATLLQRAILDRPVEDRTGLTARYDFDLGWSADDSQFGGELPKAPDDPQSPPLFTAVQEQLGLKLTATRGQVSTLVIDSVQKPSVD